MEFLRAYLHLHGMIPTALLTFGFYLLLQGARASMWRVAFLALPGTLAHELAHFVVGLCLLAQPARLSIWPKRSGNGNKWILGSVSFRSINLLNGAFVALAPLLLLPLAWLCLRYFAIPFWNKGEVGWWLLCGYLTATALLAAAPSLQDVKLAVPSMLLYASIVGLCLLAGHFY